MFEMILGHLVGDYILQNNWMALGKSREGWQGTYVCAVHCVVYTFAVCLLMGSVSFAWAAFVFASHYFLDRYSLADKWLIIIHGRSPSLFLSEVFQGSRAEELQAGFTAFVYAVVDNTMHIVIMYVGWRLLWA